MARLVAAVRARDARALLATNARLIRLARAESAIMTRLGADDCQLLLVDAAAV